MKILFASTILLVFLAYTGAVSTGEEPCPDVSDACMNDENYAICRDLIDSGCQDLVVMESCPLQFACGDTDKKPASVAASEYDSCVSLYVYEDKLCSGEPTREMTFPTWSEPGSPCCK